MVGYQKRGGGDNNGDSPGAKRPHLEDDALAMDVERELAEEENERELEYLESMEAADAALAPSLENVEAGRNWCRPPLEEALDASTQPLVFQQIECDYTIQNANATYHPTLKGASVPVVRMYGVNRQGNSVCAFVHGFEPYFYVELPYGFTPDDIDAFRRALETELVNSRRGGNTRGFSHITR